MWTVIDTLAMFVLAAIVFIIIRWRGWGVVAAIPFGYLAIHVINVLFAADSWHDREALDEWPVIGLALMPAWCLLIYVVALWQRVYRTFRGH